MTMCPFKIHSWCLVVGFACLAALARSSAGEDPFVNVYQPAISTKNLDDHWSFQPVKRPALPKVEWTDWCRNPIDRFILEKCEKAGVRPGNPVARSVLVRRIHFDLLGLPPSPDEAKKFVDDSRPGAYERLVERLLGSPHFGIKRGQHWLDLARFAETDGYEHDKIRKDAWKYRDWVIESLNEDLPFDRFVSLQLAGDELTKEPRGITATGFCLSGPDMPDINSQEERRQNVLNELTGTIGSTLLGIQFGCAQCHDHKYDPISQKDFYQLRAIFEPSLTVRKNQSLGFLKEENNKVPTSYLMIRGDWQRKGPKVNPDVPEVISRILPFEVRKVERSTGRRAGLADWMLNPKNPLTARVMVNRIWQYHFGTGLVSTPNDFGLMGELPTHPELLDWLASELVDHDWSLKHVSRLILNSATYRQEGLQSGFDEDAQPELIARFPRQRLSGETIRDAMIMAAGNSNYSMGGMGVMPPIPDELKKTLLKNQWTASKNRADHFRRSIYVFARRNLRYPLFEVFDRPDGNLSCPRRNKSITAPQSLHLLNSELSLDLSRRLAGDVLKKEKEIPNAINEIFWRVLSRSPTDIEMTSLLKFVDKQAKGIRRIKDKELALPIPTSENFDDATATAMTYLCLAIFNTNEFIYID